MGHTMGSNENSVGSPTGFHEMVVGHPTYIGWDIPPAVGGPENFSWDIPYAHFAARTPDTAPPKKGRFWHHFSTVSPAAW